MIIQESDGHGVSESHEALPVSYVPTPTRESAVERRARRATSATAFPPIPIPIPIPIPPFLLQGPRVLIWKQDPSVAEIGVRKAYLPFRVLNGPKDARTQLQGMTPVNSNVDGDFIQTPARRTLMPCMRTQSFP